MIAPAQRSMLMGSGQVGEANIADARHDEREHGPDPDDVLHDMAPR